jgi:hypothetical protein
MNSDAGAVEDGDNGGDNGGNEQDRLVSSECANCGRTVPYQGTGRRPKFCSDTCRKTTWALRENARRAGDTPPAPTVVREVIARETVRTVRVAGRAPNDVLHWARHLETLTKQLADPERLIGSRGLPWQFDRLRYTLTSALAALDRAQAELRPPPSTPSEPYALAPEPPPTTPIPAADDPSATSVGLSRQQRRAREREQRKRAR